MFYTYANPWLHMDRLFRELNGRFQGNGRSGAFPKVNAWSNADGVVLTAELPGVAPESIGVEVHDNVVSIRGDLPAPVRKDGESWHRSERPTGRFEREFRLPYRVDAKTIVAESKHGILTLTMRRLEEDKPRTIPVKAA